MLAKNIAQDRGLMRNYFILFVILISALLSACTVLGATPPLPTELIFRNWEGDTSQSILDAFKAETGITVRQFQNLNHPKKE
jgi:spermidine/putrescine-binding protein